MVEKKMRITAIAGVILLISGFIYGALYMRDSLLKKPAENIAASITIPPIDLSAPKNVEIATFSLG